VESPRCGTARAPGHFIGVMREHALAWHAPIVSHPTTALPHNSLRPARIKTMIPAPAPLWANQV
jgi:hypothetical protein